MVIVMWPDRVPGACVHDVEWVDEIGGEVVHPGLDEEGRVKQKRNDRYQSCYFCCCGSVTLSCSFLSMLHLRFLMQPQTKSNPARAEEACGGDGAPNGDSPSVSGVETLPGVKGGASAGAKGAKAKGGAKRTGGARVRAKGTPRR